MGEHCYQGHGDEREADALKGGEGEPGFGIVVPYIWPDAVRKAIIYAENDAYGVGNPIVEILKAPGPSTVLMEILYGFIMALIFIYGARFGLLTFDGPAEFATMVIGMNVTWGTIDAILFFVGYFMGPYLKMNSWLTAFVMVAISLGISIVATFTGG